MVIELRKKNRKNLSGDDTIQSIVAKLPIKGRKVFWVDLIGMDDLQLSLLIVEPRA